MIVNGGGGNGTGGQVILLEDACSRLFLHEFTELDHGSLVRVMTYLDNKLSKISKRLMLRLMRCDW